MTGGDCMSGWKTIRLELAPTTGFPSGSVSRAYLVRLPLDDDDLVDTEEFGRKPHMATIRRHWSTDPDQSGVMLHVGEHWAMRCNDDDEHVLELHRQPLRSGRQVSVV